MYTISEFGIKTGISTRTLRFYEEIGILQPAERNSSGHRLYGLDELVRLQQIQSLKFIGYSLQEIKGFITEGSASLEHLATLLTMQRRLLEEQRDALNRAIESVDYVQGLLDSGQPMNWTTLSALLHSIEFEEDLKDWMEEHFSADFIDQYFEMTQEERQALDSEWLTFMADLKKLMNEGVPPHAEAAQELPVRMGRLMTKNMSKEEMEAVAEEMGK